MTMNEPITECRSQMDTIHTQMSRLKKAIDRRGAQRGPSWADAADLARLADLLVAAADWAEQDPQ
jgi:hypothetical protein